jgi:hypothetical protein
MTLAIREGLDRSAEALRHPNSALRHPKFALRHPNAESPPSRKVREKGGVLSVAREAQLYWPAGFSAGLAEGFLVSAIEVLGFQKSGSALIHSSEG